MEGKMIVIEGGNVDFGREWYRCRKCHKLIDGLENHTACRHCKSFGDEELIPISNDQ
ncbi:MAG: hypothetical protein GX429_03065 [Bacteroidales bacterium]|nr:hypothetical protein [Bacteroidales bacterium]